MEEKLNLSKDDIKKMIIFSAIGTLLLVTLAFSITFFIDSISKVIAGKDLRYTVVSCDRLEKIEFIPNEDGVNLIRTDNGDFKITDDETKKYVDDNNMICVKYYNYTLYVKDEKFLYKVEVLKDIVFPWEEESKNLDFESKFYHEISKYTGKNFDKIREKYFPYNEEDIKEKLHKLSYF